MTGTKGRFKTLKYLHKQIPFKKPHNLSWKSYVFTVTLFCINRCSSLSDLKRIRMYQKPRWKLFSVGQFSSLKFIVNVSWLSRKLNYSPPQLANWLYIVSYCSFSKTTDHFDPYVLLYLSSLNKTANYMYKLLYRKANMLCKSHRRNPCHPKNQMLCFREYLSTGL